MRHTSHAAAGEAHELCTSILTTHPTPPFVPLALDSLTAIAQRFWSLYLEEHLARLCDYLKDESGSVHIRKAAACGLMVLFSSHPNVVHPHHVHSLDQVTISAH